MEQQELTFWDSDDGCPSVVQRRWWVDVRNEDCPLSNFVGNKQAVRRLSRAAFAAMGRPNHCCSDFSFALYGPASTGKTMLAKLFAETVRLPFVTIEPQSISKTHDIFLSIKKVCDETSFNISLTEVEENEYFLPPMVVFIDEVHNLKKSVVQGLLKATEPKDRWLTTEQNIRIDTSNVCWLIATTDRGDLFDAFDTRFQKIQLRLYSKDEIAQIVKANNSDWHYDICRLVARYNSSIPREALQFAQDMRIEHEMNPAPWDVVARVVANDHNIDESGMHRSRLEILKALGRRPISAAQLPYVVHCKEEELQRFILPPLMARTPDQPVPLVTVSSRGYTITPAGLEALDERDIPHSGIKAMPEQTRETFEAIMCKQNQIFSRRN